ncbi:LamG-like jellyroll fold domain-containing protein [Planctomycetota bacterium]
MDSAKDKNLNIKNRRPSETAMTLMETVIAMAMIAIIFAVIAPQFKVIENSWDSRQGQAESIQNGRVLIEHLAHNLSKAVQITAVSASAVTNGYIEYEDNDGNTLRYDIDVDNYVEFGQTGNLSELAGPVTQLQFTCYDACDFSTQATDVNAIRFVQVETTLTNSAANGQDKTFTTSAYLRTNKNTCPGLDPNLIGWWKMDEGSGQIAADSSGNNNDGQLGSTAGVDDGDPTWIIAPERDSAISLDGSDDYITGIGDCPTSDYTIAGWAKDTGPVAGDWSVLYCAEQEIWLGVDREASPTLWLDCGGNGNGANTAAGAWTRDVWHHIAATWDGSNLHIYIDGVDMPITVYGTPEDPQAKAAVIGGWSQKPTDESWYGGIDDVRLYNRALTAEEISQIIGVKYEQFTEAKADSDTTSVTVSTPSGTGEGDLLIAAVATDGDTSASMAPPGGEGWTEIDVDHHSGEITMGVWWKLADAGESASHQFTWSPNEQSYAWMMRFTGHDPLVPINDTSLTSGSASSPTSPAVTTTVSNCIILRLGGFDGDDVTVDSPGLSGHAAITMDQSNSGSDTSSGGAGYVFQQAVGDSGTSSFSLTGSQEYRTVTIAIAPDTQGGESGGSCAVLP